MNMSLPLESKSSAQSSHNLTSGWLLSITSTLLVLTPSSSQAVPAFARQTGQNCIACHAGGQFPELTPYGRLFKLTGYTIGERTLPLSVMASGGLTSVSKIAAVNQSLVNNTSTGLDLPLKNKQTSLDIASLFIAGKVTDNIGLFSQITHDRYSEVDDQGLNNQGHTTGDNFDLRWADQWLLSGREFIYGVSLNNNPSVSDPWNTSWAWMQYVPSSSGPGANAYLDANTPYASSGLPGDLYSGLSTYLFWNKSYYGEIGFYRSASRLLHFMNFGNDPNASILQGNSNRYWRFAYNHEWGSNNLMVGTSGMAAHPYDSANGVSSSDALSYQGVKNVGVDTQYQYLLDPHTFTVQAVVQKQNFTPSVWDATLNGNTPSTTRVSRVKFSYVHAARNGVSFANFNQNGGFASATQGNTLEVFHLPVQNIRIGLQMTFYSKLANIDSPSNANSPGFTFGGRIE